MALNNMGRARVCNPIIRTQVDESAGDNQRTRFPTPQYLMKQIGYAPYPPFYSIPVPREIPVKVSDDTLEGYLDDINDLANEFHKRLDDITDNYIIKLRQRFAMSSLHASEQNHQNIEDEAHEPHPPKSKKKKNRKSTNKNSETPDSEVTDSQRDPTPPMEKKAEQLTPSKAAGKQSEKRQGKSGNQKKGIKSTCHQKSLSQSEIKIQKDNEEGNVSRPVSEQSKDKDDANEDVPKIKPKPKSPHELLHETFMQCMSEPL